MKLSTMIRADSSQLTTQWEAVAARLQPAGAALGVDALRDDVPNLLQAIASDLERERSSEAEAAAAGALTDEARLVSEYAIRHVATRLGQGFSLEGVVAEYTAMRTTVQRRWQAVHGARDDDITDLIRFNEAIDRVLSDSIAWYLSRVAYGRDLFLGVLGHDLRTPLGAITMSAQLLLRDEALPERSTKPVLRIFNSATRMQKMINDLLDFTRTRLGGSLPTYRLPTQLGPLFCHTVEELAALHPDARIQYACEGDLSGKWDVGRLEQMLSNLIGNAIQHGDRAQSVSVLARGAEQEVVITVHNHGAPIPGVLIDQMFDPLTQGAREHRQSQGSDGGLGLGLYISREIARAHGGDIKARSSAAAGTTFTVTLART